MSRAELIFWLVVVCGLYGYAAYLALTMPAAPKHEVWR